MPVDGLKAIPFTPLERRLIDAVVEIYPRSARREYLIDAVWGTDPNGGPVDPNNNIDVHRVRINRVMRPIGWEVVSRRGLVSLRRATA